MIGYAKSSSFRLSNMKIMLNDFVFVFLILFCILKWFESMTATKKCFRKK